MNITLTEIMLVVGFVVTLSTDNLAIQAVGAFIIAIPVLSNLIEEYDE